MTWLGYFTYDDTEIVNVSRTEAYAARAGAPWFKPAYENEALQTLVEDPLYFDPVSDPAPWYDADIPASKDFWGYYPLGVTGLEDSTRTSNVTPSTVDGGTPGRVRHGMRQVVFNGVLVGGSDEAVDYGMAWLRRALLGAECAGFRMTTRQALGLDLTYLASEPRLDDDLYTSPRDVWDRLVRTSKRVVVNNGPTITGRSDDLSCGGSAWTVQFTATIGTPWEFGQEVPILQNFGTSLSPWVPGVTPGPITGPEGHVDVVCGENLWTPIFDPECPALIVPPPPASIPLGCWEPPSTWTRYTAEIDPDLVPRWGSMVPTLILYAGGTTIRDVRVRLWQRPVADTSGRSFLDGGSASLETDEPADGGDPGGSGGDLADGGTPETTVTTAYGTLPTDDPCAYVADMVVSYIPPGGTMILDGVSQSVNVITDQGHKRRADSLVFASDGSPFLWPELTCGYGYTLTYDVATGGTLPALDVSLTPRMV